MVRSIKAKILLWLAVVTLPLLGAAVFSFWFVHIKLSERIDLDLLNASRLEAARIRDSLKSYRLSVESLVSTPLVDAVTFGETVAEKIEVLTAMSAQSDFPFDEAAPGSMPLDMLSARLLDSASSAGSEIANIMLVGTDLSLLGSTRGFSWQPYDPAITARAIEEQRTLFGNAFLGEDATPLLGIVTPVIGDTNVVVGAAIVEVRLGPIVDLVVEHEGFGETSEAHIAQPTADGDAEFITLMRFARSAAFNKVVPASRNLPINWSLQSPERRIVKSPDYRAVPSILALQTIPETGWGLVVKIDQAEAMQPVIEIQRALLIACAVAIIFIGLFIFLLLVPLTRRLGAIEIAADRIAAGDYSSQIGDMTEDEIGKLGRGFDRMSLALERETRKRLAIEKKIRYQASHDALTDLHNRASIRELLNNLDKAAGNKTHTVVFIDLDGFKFVNDNYGHAAGDCILQQVSAKLVDIVANRGVVGRWGGDEFVVVLPATTIKESRYLKERIDLAFTDNIEALGHSHPVGCSIGVASNERGCSLIEALDQADSRMYQQKQQTRYSGYQRAA